MLDLVRSMTDLRKERERQDDKWGEQNHDLTTWTTVLAEEFGEACEAVLELRASDGSTNADLACYRRTATELAHSREELVQTAAVAVAAIEYIDRQTERRGVADLARISTVLVKERIRQDDTVGEQNHDLLTWMTLLGKAFGAACKAILELRASDGSYNSDLTTHPRRVGELTPIRDALVQTAAVALAAIEYIDRQVERPIRLGRPKPSYPDEEES